VKSSSKIEWHATDVAQEEESKYIIFTKSTNLLLSKEIILSMSSQANKDLRNLNLYK
jgi:hypothetical protein